MKIANIGKILSLHNRGILLDIFVFIINIFLIRLVTNNFIKLTHAPDDDLTAKYAVALFITGLLLLSPLGATLKRHRFWTRIKSQNKESEIVENADIFIFAPAFCFLWMCILSLIAGILWYEVLLYQYLSWGKMFLAVFFGAPVYSIGGAFIVRRFFKPPLSKPFWNFLDSPLSGALGDVCIFLNMICFQIFGGVLADEPWKMDYVLDIFFHLIGFALLLLLFYFPPRNFYLVEDIKRPIILLTIVLANLPVFIHLFFGSI